MGWGAYLLALLIVVLGLGVLERIAPSAVLPVVGILLLGVLVHRPGVAGEIRAIFSR